MNKQTLYTKFIPAASLFVGLPLLLWLLGDFPRRSIFKELLSLLTILAFCFMLAQFYLTRHNKHFAKGREFAAVVKWHRYLGYIFIGVLVLHPFFIVLARFFEAGVSPGDAFWTMITEFDSLGVVLGLTAYGLMLVLFITTFLRSKFNLQYRTGRMFHGYLAVLFVVVSAWHVITIGRHINTPFVVYIILMALSGVIHLFRTYYYEAQKQLGHE